MKNGILISENLIKNKGIDEVVILENNGIGYEIFCSSAAFARLCESGEGGIYTYFQVREDGVALFGAATGTCQHLPGVVAMGGEQQQLHVGTGAHALADEAGGQYAAVVEDEAVAGLEQALDIAEGAVGESARLLVHHQQTAGITGLHRLLSNQLFGQIVIKITL